MGNLSLDGSKIHADASKSRTVSYKRMLELEGKLQREVAEYFELGERADQGEEKLPVSLVVLDEIELRQERLMKLAEAKAVLEARAQERYAAEKAEYEAQVREREARARKRHQKPRGKMPKPPEAGPREQDQYNFTNPDSRVMKNSTNTGFDQHCNVQVAADQASIDRYVDRSECSFESSER